MRSRTFALRNGPHGTAKFLFQKRGLASSPRSGPNPASLYTPKDQGGCLHSLYLLFYS